MLMVTPMTSGAVEYFFDGRDAGRWVGDGSAALGVAGAVSRRDLQRALDGRAPDGHRLVRAVPHRRAGWDLTFAAPKSVSLVAALTGATGVGLVTAHRAAVTDALDWLALHGCRSADGGLSDPVVARFEHLWSDGGDPHLHTHAVLANLGYGGGRWRPLASSPLWPTLRPLGDVYRLALRARSAPVLEWRHDPTGLIDLAGVPRSAIEAVSVRTAAVGARLDAWDDRELARRPVRRAVRAVTRGGTAPGPWEQRAADGGLDRRRATELLTAPAIPQAAAPAATTPDGVAPATVAVADWLAGRTTTFTTLDVVRAFGAVHPGGLDPATLDARVAAFVGDPEPWASGRRWTTTRASATEQRLLAACRATASLAVDGSLIATVAAEHHLPADAAAEVDRLVAGTGRAVVSRGAAGHSTLLSQAGVLAAARSCWQASGWSVGVISTPAGARRWDALAGLVAADPDRLPDVVVVDRADRMAPPMLETLIAAVARRGGRTVLVEGGTLPARHHPASSLFAELGRGSPTLDRLRLPLHRGPAAVVTGPPDQPGAGPGRSGPVVAGLGTADALGALVERWASSPAGARPVLVGLGPAEVEALNVAAHGHLVDTGAVEGPALSAGGREYQRGDRVLALRMLGTVPSGTTGVVTAVGPRGRDLTVGWADPAGRTAATSRVDRHDARRIGHAYALTAARVGTAPAGTLLLGDPASARRLAAPPVAATVVAPGGVRRPPDVLDRLAEAVPGAVEAHGRAVRVMLGTSVAELETRRRQLASRLHGARFGAGPPGDPGQWVTVHGADLVEHRALGRAAQLRTEALTRTAPDRGRARDGVVGQQVTDLGLGLGR